MKFLLDVNASGAVSSWLEDQGYDVTNVNERNNRMSDEEILEWAVKEQRIVVTTGKDFEAMVWIEGRSYTGVLRLENLPRKE